MKLRRLRCVSFQTRGQNQGAVAKPSRGAGCRSTGQRRISDKKIVLPRKAWISKLRRFRAPPSDARRQATPDAGRQASLEPKLAQYLPAILESCWIRDEWPGGNGIQVVPDHVGENEGDHPSLRQKSCQPSPLETREMFSDGVQFLDGCAGAEQRLRAGQLIGQRDAWSRSN